MNRIAEGREHPTKTPANSQVSPEGGANSGAIPSGTQDNNKPTGRDLAAALALIAGLPLTDDEKAQAVRRLLTERPDPG
jgi:hypothetical protein